MNEFKNLLCAIVFFSGTGSALRAQQPPEILPGGPFKTVHLVIVTPTQEVALKAAVKDFNRGFFEQGCLSCTYRVFKMVVGKDNKYNYMITGDWPGRDVYIKIHSSVDYGAANKRNPIMSELSDTEFYGRYVEDK